jgi:hypothetical protein
MEAHYIQEFFDTFIIVRDIAFVRSLVVALLQDSVSGLAINAHSVNVNLCTMTSLLLNDAEGIVSETRLVNADHIGMSLTEITRKDEHVLDLLEHSLPLRSALDVAKIEMVDVADIIRSE